ncbi:MAG: DUF1801 domain-containing protein [Phaeodactylibacter sp.]|uniref:DUF1801 domain-containing protein n=1 Tax=Phaeodactylibacter sp. TaxID=1940289 RepID=UPI0032ED6BB7
MTAVETYILNLEEPQRGILEYLHQLLMANPEVTCNIRYKIPFYSRKSWVCYTNPRDGGIELAFIQGAELSNEQGLLQARGRKMVTGVVFYAVDDIPEAALLEVIQEALLLDEVAPYNGPKGSRNS